MPLLSDEEKQKQAQNGAPYHEDEEPTRQDAQSREPAAAGGDSVEQPKNDENTATPTIIGAHNADAPDARPDYSIFSRRAKLFVVLMTVFATLFSPFSSFIYLPALTPIAVEYARPIADINLTVTLYQIMQAIAPVFFGDLSDQIGRRPVYFITFTIYIGANVGLALQHNFAALLVLRAVQSTGSSATVAIGSAVMADLITSSERGGSIAAVQASAMFAPALAPVIGGILTQFLGWRSTFWFLTIGAGVFLVCYVPFVPETAREIVGNGSIRPPSLNASLFSRRMFRQREKDAETAATSPPSSSGSAPRSRKRKLPIPNIWAAVLILFEKDVGLLMLFMSLFVMANFAMLVPLQDVIRRRYDFNDLQTGLCYMPFAIGSVFAAVASGKLMNWNYARVARQIGVTPDRKKGDDLRKFPIERARLDLIWPWTFLAVAMTVAWGWVVTAGTSLAAPLVVLFFAGAGLAGPIAIFATLLVDLYPMNPGRASSSWNLARSSFSAVGTAVVQYIIQAWGYGFTYLFLGLLVLAVSPVVLIVRKYGQKWREERYLRFERQRLTKESA
jgi:multidrug resistance protein